MSICGEGKDAARGEGLELKQQFPALTEMLRALNSARKQCSMYGTEHPNTSGAISRFIECVNSLVEEIGTATFVLTGSSLIVNDGRYVPNDTHDLYERLRVRGVLGLTFLSGPSPEQALAFLAFLNAEPRDIKAHGGPSSYLRKHGVSRIVVTEQVYELEDEPTECEPALSSQADVDRVLGLALEWLLKHDEESEDEEQMPVLPIGEILADPDEAAKLIREAVTKLHVSRSPRTDMRTLSHEVITELKDLSGLDHEAWDRATPQVRKAISKLPPEMRPSNGGFVTQPQTDAEKELQRAWRAADVAEVEAMIDAAVSRTPGEATETADEEPLLENLEEYFTVRPTGIISGWQNELDSSALTASSISTLSTLLSWEQSPTEHGRLSTALAALLKRSVENEDLEAAAQCASHLTDEALRGEKLSWRMVNARTALRGLDVAVLKDVASYAMEQGRISLAAALVETNPELAVAMSDLLGVKGGDEFAASLQRGLVDAGSAGIACLGKLLRSGSQSQAQMALELLVELQDGKALAEIRDALSVADDWLIASALTVMPDAALSRIADAVLGLVSHKSPDIRCAAVRALGRIGDPDMLPHLFQLARLRLVGGPTLAEQIAAVEAIGMIQDTLSREFLARMARHKSLFRRTRAAKLRAAASAALDRMTLCANDKDMAA